MEAEHGPGLRRGGDRSAGRDGQIGDPGDQLGVGRSPQLLVRVVAEADREDAVDLALTMADADAGAEDYEGALRWLDVVEKLNVTVPLAYADKREAWQRLA